MSNQNVDEKIETYNETRNELEATKWLCDSYKLTCS
jgi:hypothetical protein